MSDLMAVIHGLFDSIVHSKDQLTIKRATEQLEGIRFDMAYANMFFTYITNNEIPLENRLSAALYFKNAVSKYWSPDETDAPALEKAFGEDTKKYIKDNFAKLLMLTPRKIGENLADIANVIGKVELKTEWPQFLPELLQGLQSPSQDTHFVVLQTLKKLFKKYRYSFATKEIVDEMLMVIPATGPVILGMMKTYAGFLHTSIEGKDKNGEEVALELIGLILHIFYSLNCVELPAFFEDTLTEWMTYFKYLLELKLDSESIRKCKTRVIKDVTLYCEKYAEDFKDYLLPCFGLIYSQIELTTMESEYDKLVANILKFMQTIVYNEQARPVFLEKMPLFFEKLIYPNMVITEYDLEQFETAPDTYISNDLEEADTETRRRNCINLVHALGRNFQINPIVMGIVQSELAKYNQDMRANWTAKVNVINFLIGAHAIQYTLRTGATLVSASPGEIEELLKTCVFPELDKTDDMSKESTFIKTACVKYLFIFRNHIPTDWIMHLVIKLADLMKHPNKILASYACATIERFFFVKGPDKRPVITKESLSKFVINILSPLCHLLTVQQNIYGIKTLYRVIQTAEKDILPYGATLAQMFAGYLEAAIAQPANQTYNYMLFECVGLALKLGKDTELVDMYEQNVTPAMFGIVQKNIPELISYAFQILSMFVLYKKDLQPNYQVLMGSIVGSKNNWDNNMRYLIPGMIQYARAYIIKCNKELLTHVKTLIEIFEQALRLRLDESAFSLLTTIFTTFTYESLKDHYVTIFTTIFRRIQHDKNESAARRLSVPFSRGLLLFISLFVNIYGFADLKRCTDQIQPGILTMLLNSEAGSIKQVEGVKQRKEVVVAFCKVMLGIENMTPELFKVVLENLIQLIDSGIRRGFMGGDTEDLAEDNMQRMKHQQLYTATIEDVYRGDDGANEKAIILKTLADLGMKLHTSVMGMVSSMLSKEKMETLQKFMKETNIYLQ